MILHTWRRNMIKDGMGLPFGTLIQYHDNKTVYEVALDGEVHPNEGWYEEKPSEEYILAAFRCNEYWDHIDPDLIMDVGL